MQGAFFYSGICAFASGIFLRSFFDCGWVLILWLGLITCTLGLWWYKNRDEMHSKQLLLVIVVGLCFIVGLARLQWHEENLVVSILKESVDSKVELSGLVIAEPEITAKSTRLVVLIDDTTKVLVSADRYAEVMYGDSIIFSGTLKKPESFATEFDRTFNYPGYLAVRDIFYTVSFAHIEVISRCNGNVIIEKLLFAKQRFLESIQLAIAEPEVGLGAGLLLGVKSSLGDELEDAFRATGIIHIVVLSGANIMLVVLFVMYLLSLFLPVRPRVIVGIITIILFALLVGLSATVVRASVMAVLVLLALGLGRHYAILRALFFAGFCMLLINPLLLVYDVGFQLSFLATLGLIVAAPQFETMLASVPSPFKIKDYFLATMATQIMILPLLLYQIGQFSLVAIVVNMLVLPLVPVAMLLTFITGIVGLLSAQVAALVGVAAYMSLAYIIQLATWFAALPYAAVTVPAFPFFVVPVSYFLIGLMLYLWSRREKTRVILPDVSQWTIVEEFDETVGSVTKNETSQSAVPSPVIPIFFR